MNPIAHRRRKKQREVIREGFLQIPNLKPVLQAIENGQCLLNGGIYDEGMGFT